MFDTLIESRTDVKRFWRPATFATAFALHFLVLSVILVQNYFKVPPITEPSIHVTFARFTPPPAPPPPAPKPPAPTPPPKPVAETPPPMPREMVQPETTPEVVHTEPVPELPEEPVAEGIEGGVPGGVPGGVAGGVPGGIPEGPLQVGGDVTAPVAISQAPPVYPMAARSARVQGVVKLEAVIRKDGTVGDIRVVQGLGMGCTDAAIEALKKWRFQPGMRNGIPVDVYYVLTVAFRLN